MPAACSDDRGGRQSRFAQRAGIPRQWVVRDVSSVMSMTCADIWIPITSVPVLAETANAERSAGPVVAYLLASGPDRFEAVRDEVNRRRLQYNATLQERYVDTLWLSTPKQTELQKLDYGSSLSDIIRRYLLIALVFMLVPAINLTGLISSRMQERTEEMGLRKAFWGRCAYVGVAGADRKPDADLYRRAGRFAGVVGAGCRVA